MDSTQRPDNGKSTRTCTKTLSTGQPMDARMSYQTYMIARPTPVTWIVSAGQPWSIRKTAEEPYFSMPGTRIVLTSIYASRSYHRERDPFNCDAALHRRSLARWDYSKSSWCGPCRLLYGHYAAGSEILYTFRFSGCWRIQRMGTRTAHQYVQFAAIFQPEGQFEAYKASVL